MPSVFQGGTEANRVYRVPSHLKGHLPARCCLPFAGPADTFQWKHSWAVAACSSLGGAGTPRCCGGCSEPCPAQPCQAGQRDRGCLPPTLSLQNLQKSLLLPVTAQIARSCCLIIGCSAQDRQWMCSWHRNAVGLREIPQQPRNPPRTHLHTPAHSHAPAHSHHAHPMMQKGFSKVSSRTPHPSVSLFLAILGRRHKCCISGFDVRKSQHFLLSGKYPPSSPGVHLCNLPASSCKIAPKIFRRYFRRKN